MSEQGAVVAANIDRILEAIGPDGQSSPARPGVEDLVASIGEYLTLPIPRDLRASAERVAGLDSAADAEVFSQALLALRRALKDQFAQEEAAAQLAEDPEMLQEFLVESRAHLAGVESGLLRLEELPDDAEAINAVFRSFHTIKGLAGFLGASAIQELAHETENVLDEARAGRLVPDPAVVDLILRATDELGRCLDLAGEQGVRQMPRCNSALLAALAALANPAAAAKDGETCAPVVTTLPVPQPAVSGLNPPPRSRAGRAIAEVSVVRVETAKLEYLIDMVGELVIAESVIRHNPRLKSTEDPLLSRNFAQLGRVVQEVQKTSMSMRMVAVGNLFRKMTRLVRDLARKSGKSIAMVTVGDDVELDRSIVEDLADPMIHMMRNAVDHGLEMPAARIATGKSESGTIILKAAHDAGEIVIEISDDGRGLDPAKILARARSQGIVAADIVPDDEAIFKLIFEPGFSTADKVTDMSGRGVGMDVVRKQIQKLRGRIGIRSTLGKGCTFTLRLPLTLAIIDGLVVGVGTQRFILPLFAVREMFAPDAKTLVTLENRAEAAHFRDRLYPLVRLSRLLECRSVVEAEDAGSADSTPGQDTGTLIIVESREGLLCLAVDQLIGKQEVVIKSLGPAFRDVPAVSGGAILGDGRVGLIIDVNSLRHGRVV